MSVSSKRGSELLSFVAACVEDEKRHGLQSLGERVATRLAFEWGGQQLYIPFDKIRRNAQIFEMFTGNNTQELAQHFHMSDSAVRRVINDERARRRQKQMFLPGVQAE